MKTLRFSISKTSNFSCVLPPPYTRDKAGSNIRDCRVLQLRRQNAFLCNIYYVVRVAVRTICIRPRVHSCSSSRQGTAFSKVLNMSSEISSHARSPFPACSHWLPYLILLSLQASGCARGTLQFPCSKTCWGIGGEWEPAQALFITLQVTSSHTLTQLRKKV